MEILNIIDKHLLTLSVPPITEQGELRHPSIALSFLVSQHLVRETLSILVVARLSFSLSRKLNYIKDGI